MSTIEQFINDLERNHPEKLLDPSDLSKIGLGTMSTLSKWRTSGLGPSFLKLSDGSYKYIRRDVISWLRDCYVEKTHNIKQEHELCVKK